MQTMFSDAKAETREDFLSLVQKTSATFYEVYSATPNYVLECLFAGMRPGELLLRFDMEAHSAQARARFCELSDLERRAYCLPAEVTQKPIPYFASFVPGIGHIGIAWTSDDIRELLARTRKDEQRAQQVAKYAADSKKGNIQVLRSEEG